MTGTKTEPAAMPLDGQDERLIRTVGLRGTLAGALTRVRTGDVGSLPVVVGLVIIFAIFQMLNPSFLSSGNLVDLATECAAVGTISIGVVLVLLVGQIDLSIGSMSGVASAIVGVGLTAYGWPMWMAVAASPHSTRRSRRSA